jgi:hypothetical protein
MNHLGMRRTASAVVRNTCKATGGSVRMISIWSAFERFQEIHAPVTHIWITFSSISLGRCSVKLTEAPDHTIGVQLGKPCMR